MPKRVPGLYKRYSKDDQTYVRETDKQIGGKRIRRTTGTSDHTEAQRHLAREIECARQRDVYGVTEARTFLQGATRYLKENGHKRDLNRDATALDVFPSRTSARCRCIRCTWAHSRQRSRRDARR